MYALVKTGGKQYRVAKDDTILVERIAADEGSEVILDDVVMLGDGDKVTIGTPRVEGAAVSATVMRQTRGPKIIIFRRKRRKNHRRTQGHRQDLTLLKINMIAEDGKSLKPKAAPKKGRTEDEAKAEAKAAPKKAAAKKATARKPRRRLKRRQRRKRPLRRKRPRRRKRPPRRRQQRNPNLARHPRRQLKGAGKWHIKSRR